MGSYNININVNQAQRTLRPRIPGPEQPTTWTQNNKTHTPRTQHGAPPRSFSTKGGKDVAYSYLLEHTRPTRGFECTC